MNQLDKQYTDLLQDILNNGVKKQDRTGTGTISVFARQIRHNMKDGFPLLTTKKMPFKTIVTELLWFLRGDTNIKYLVDNNCHIWDGDAFKNFMTKSEGDPDVIWNQEQFINKIKTDDEFAKEWGELGPVYGAQWRGRLKGYGFDEITGAPLGYGIDPKLDQIQNLINDLKGNPDSRRLMVNAWNVGELDSMVLPPCHYGFQVYTRELSDEERLPKKIKLTGHGGEIEFSLTDKREIKCKPKNGSFIEDLDENWLTIEKLKDNEVFYQSEWGWGVFVNIDTFETISYDGTEWGGHKLNVPTRAISLMWNQRSVDTFLGLPFNIASYGLLLEIIAKQVNMVPDELIGNLGDVHLYSNHLVPALEQIGRELSLEERRKLWVSTGMGWKEEVSELLQIQEYNCRFIPKRTREPFPLPTFDCPVLDEISHTTFDELVFKLQPCDFYMDDYVAHPTIKAPLSN